MDPVPLHVSCLLGAWWHPSQCPAVTLRAGRGKGEGGQRTKREGGSNAELQRSSYLHAVVEAERQRGLIVSSDGLPTVASIEEDPRSAVTVDEAPLRLSQTGTTPTGLVRLKRKLASSAGSLGQGH
ncbi:hypothetical protein B0T26DRAFT_681888 [Lasiosphaeria miniovina]|uniref:Uncharacterized protein n=1 Tax=Lasiosphaeria miniovina TaxID=1954250 RepID=A0AA39ZQH2_9PEZI|nr:uncharacterized protein B0T26DRAFT_681888 [Lasiosphaeria miniovina]KAK0701776.1 hypothetical protein B0T26DRAFT_681888 [Lasiosphaeria miniovina]